MASGEQPEGREVPLVWVGADEVPVFFANQFVAQVDRGECFLTVGQLVPPPIYGGTPEQIREQVEQLEFVQVRPVARIAFTPDRLHELISMLDVIKQTHEKQREVFGDPRNP